MTTHTNVKSWNELWEEMKSGPSGGQATSKIGKRLDGTIDSGFIKILTEQDNSERRQRFYREAAILESLSIDGIPKLIETNARNFGDKSYDLYIVSAYIPGKTLQGDE